MTTAELADRTAAACSHCGLPVPRALLVLDCAEQFCCDGCATVYAALHDWGLERFYRLRDASRAAPRPARPSGRSFAEMDEPEYLARASAERAVGSRSVTWVLEGLHCAACVWLVERLPRLDDGVLETRLDLARGRVDVVWDPERTTLSAVARTLDRLGYTPHPDRAGTTEALRRTEDRRMLVRLGVAGACAANVMAIAFALYGGLLHGIEDEYAAFFRWTSLLIALPAFVVGGAPFFRGALSSLRARRLHMDVPIALGLAAGLLHGAANTIRGTGEVYFDSVTGLVFLLLAGRFLQQRRQRAAGDAAASLASLAPRTARIVEGAEVRETAADLVRPGMIVEVRSGDTVPVDGTVVSGCSSLDLALLTGESRPVDVAVGDAVHAGTVNLEARLLVRAETTGEATRVGRLAKLVAEHARRKPPIVVLADRIAGLFVAVVLVAAAIVALSWWPIDPEGAVDHTIALLIVSCPCALALATPLAFAAAIGRAARAGILIKGGDVVERLASPGRIWLDKTGTLTEGRLAVTDWAGDATLAPLVAALERESSHPAAVALAATASDGERLVVAQVEETRGSGIEGLVGGRRVCVGSPAFLARRCGPPPEAIATAVSAWTERGLTPVVVAVDGVVKAAAALGDRLRPDAAAGVARMRRLGWKVGILSGDHPAVVRAVAQELGVDPGEALGGVGPEAKLEIVENGRNAGPVVMAGDGVNDAAALAAASVGIGVRGGAEAALEAADVYVNRTGVTGIAATLEGARRAMRVVRRNLAFSLAYNALGIGLAAAGLINPLVAAILMPASSLTVIVSSYRAATFPQAEDG